MELDASYFQNMRTVEALGKEYEFESAFFWQPVILTGHKELTAEEVAMRKSCQQEFAGLEFFFLKIYALVHSESRPKLFDISDALDGEKGTLYIDFAHPGPRGNQLVAARMFEILHRQLRTVCR